MPIIMKNSYQLKITITTYFTSCVMCTMLILKVVELKWFLVTLMGLSSVSVNGNIPYEREEDKLERWYRELHPGKFA